MKKTYALVAAVLATAIALGGCGNGNGDKTNTEDLKNASYPLQTTEKLTYWGQGSSFPGGYTKETLPFIEEFEKRVGVDIDWVVPAAGQEVQKFNIMLASGEMCDIIDWYWADYSGGPDKAIEDGAILSLNDLLEDYSPALAKYLKENEYVDVRAKTDAGNYYYYPGLVEYGGEKDRLRVTAGYMFRKDWLDKYGLEIPETIDDWYNVLTVFKNNGVEAPLCIPAKEAFRGLSGAFGAAGGWYQEDGVVKYGPMQPEFKEFVATMNKWYREGLIDSNTISLDTKTVDSKLLNGQAGAVFGWIGSGMNKWLTAAESTGIEGFDLVGVPYPVKNKGEKTKFATKDAIVYSRGAAISATCKNPELAAKVLDYGYTEEGNMFFNFGIEGDTYEMIDGYPTFTDKIKKNPDGLTMDEALSVFTKCTGRDVYIQRLEIMEQRYTRPQQKEAQQRWLDTDVDKCALPALTPTSEEASEHSSIMNDVTTYVDEMYFKFLMGKEPMDNYDAFTAQLEKYGIDRAREIYQNALDRFNSR